MSNSEIVNAVAEADRWLESHRVSEAWRTMSRLRDTLVRYAADSRTARAEAWDEGHEAAIDQAGEQWFAAWSEDTNPYRQGADQ